MLWHDIPWSVSLLCSLVGQLGHGRSLLAIGPWMVIAWSEEQWMVISCSVDSVHCLVCKAVEAHW